MGQHVRRVVLGTVAALLGCHAEAPPPDAAPPPPSLAVPHSAPAPPARRRAVDDPSLPLSTGERLWGVELPIGCTPRRGDRERIVFDCRLYASDLERYFRIRLQGLRVAREGHGALVSMESGSGPLVRVTPLNRGGVRSRLTFHRDRHAVPDATADAILARLGATQAEAPTHPD